MDRMEASGADLSKDCEISAHINSSSFAVFAVSTLLQKQKDVVSEHTYCTVKHWKALIQIAEQKL